MVDLQKVLIDRLSVKEKEYRCVDLKCVYKEHLLKEHCKWLKLNSKMYYLMGKIKI